MEVRQLVGVSSLSTIHRLQGIELMPSGLLAKAKYLYSQYSQAISQPTWQVFKF